MVGVLCSKTSLVNVDNVANFLGLSGEPVKGNCRFGIGSPSLTKLVLDAAATIVRHVDWAAPLN